MAAGSPDRFPKHLQTLFTSGAIAGLDDGALLERFAASRDEAAFEVLVARHGPMVLRVCRAALADPHDADDAFQAVFLVLVRRAVAIRSRASVASWLFGVASRVSARAKVDATRRRKHEQRVAEGRPATAPRLGDEPLDSADVLHEELARLPDRYREALVLCYLEGHTCDAAAARLRRPVGTIKARLSRARGIMKHRLLRRGVTLPAGLLAAGASIEATAAPFPPELVTLTVASAPRFAAGAAAAPARVLVLAEGVLTSMFLQKIKLAAFSCTAVLAAGMVLVAWGASHPGDEPPARVGVKSAKAAAGEPPVAAGAGTPEEVFSQAIEAIDRDRIEDFVGLLHPEAVKQLRATVSATAEALAKQGKADQLFSKFTGAGSVGELKSLDDRRFAATYLAGLIRSLPLFKLTLAATMGEVLGHVDDGKENVYIVYRSMVDEKGAIRDQVNVARLRKDGSKWRMEIPERIGMFIQTQKRSSGGNLPELPEPKERESARSYEPVGRLITGGDSAHVVLRRVTPVGYFTNVLTVKKSDLGWDEALAGKPEGLAKLVRAKFHQGSSPDGEPSRVARPEENARAAFGADSPEAVFSQAIDALDRGRIVEFVGLMHPEALKQLRTTVRATDLALAKQGKADGTRVDAFPEVKNLGNLDKLDDRQFMAGYLSGLFSGFLKLKLTMARTKGEILGHVDEGKENVHVVYRSTTDAKGASRDQLNVAGLRKDGSRWALEIPDDLAMFVETAKQGAAGTPMTVEMNAVKSSRVEPLGRFLTGGDTAYVVFRLVTTLGNTALKNTFVLTVRKSDLGWDEALAGKPKGLARLVRSDYHLDPSPDEEPGAAPRKVPAGAPADRVSRDKPAAADEMPAATVDAEPRNKAVLAKLERPITLKYTNATPLARVVSDIAKATQGPNDPGIAIYVDPVGINEAEKTMTSPVTFDVEGVPLKDALPRLLTPLGLAYCVYDGLLILSHAEQIDQNFRRVPVIARDKSPGTRAVLTRLEQPVAMRYPDETPLERVIADVVKATKGPNDAGVPIYVDPGGLDKAEKTMTSIVTMDLAGVPLRTTLRLLLLQLGLSYSVRDGLLIVSELDDIAWWLLDEPPVIVFDRSPGTRAIVSKLKQPIVLDYSKETPLQQVITDIVKATQGPNDPGIAIYVDPAGLKVVEQTMASTVRLAGVDGVPLRTTLWLLLKQLRLAYFVEDGRLTVSDEESVVMKDRQVDRDFKKAVIAGDRSPRTTAVLIKLEQPVALRFPDEVPLKQVVAEVIKATRGPDGAGLPIYVTPLGFNSVEQTLSMLVPPAFPEGTRWPLRVSLRLLFSRLGMDYYVHDGLVIVSGADLIDEEVQKAPVLALDQSPRTGAVLAGLEHPIALKYPDPTPLDRVLSDIREATQGPNNPGIPIQVDPAGLRAARKTMSSPVTIDLEGIPLRMSLRLVLGQLGLDYYVDDGRLAIGDEESVEAKRAAAAKDR